MVLQQCYGFDLVVCRFMANALNAQNGNKSCKFTALIWSSFGLLQNDVVLHSVYDTSALMDCIGMM